MIADKFTLQDKHYEFPYHYIPYFDQHGVGVKTRVLGWGLEYLCYIKHIQELAYSLQPQSVLDVGCGDGRFLGMLGSRVPRRAGVDLSEQAIRFAKAFNPDVVFHVIDVADLEETFDLVVAIEVLEHIPDEQITNFLNALVNRTREGGHIIISVPTIVKPVLGKHYRHYDLDLLRNQLESIRVPLDIVQVEYIYKQYVSLFIKVIERLLQNQWWTLDIYFLRGPVWWYIWQKRRLAASQNGRHLVAVLKKLESNR